MRNIFWRNTRLEKHRPDDPLDTAPAPAPAPAPVSRGGCTCEFCGCRLAPSGEVLRMGDKAKSFRDHADTIEGKDKEIAALQKEVTDLKAKLAAAVPPAPAGDSRRVGRLVE